MMEKSSYQEWASILLTRAFSLSAKMIENFLYAPLNIMTIMPKLLADNLVLLMGVSKSI